MVVAKPMLQVLKIGIIVHFRLPPVTFATFYHVLRLDMLYVRFT